MNTLVKKIKPIAMGLVITALAIGFSAFTTKSKNIFRADTYWFKVAGENILASPVNESELDLELCDLDYATTRPICAVAFESNIPLTEPPVSDINDTDLIDVNGEPTADSRYKMDIE